MSKKTRGNTQDANRRRESHEHRINIPDIANWRDYPRRKAARLHFFRHAHRKARATGMTWYKIVKKHPVRKAKHKRASA